MTSFMSANSLIRDPARKAAITVNVATALLGALKVANKETLSAPGDLKGQAVEKVMEEMLHVSASIVANTYKLTRYRPSLSTRINTCAT